jgi:hypothetical protein
LKQKYYFSQYKPDMKNYAIPLVLLFASCKTYHYQTPTINTNMYSKAGEVQAGVQFGSAGVAADAGIALTKNINVNGYASFFPESDDGYNSREIELSVGYQATPGKNRRGVVSIFAGIGHGDNEYDKKGLVASFNRPFLQIQSGSYDNMIGRRSSVYFDAFFGTRLNWLIYDGTVEGTVLKDDFLYFEPYYGISIGSSRVRFHFITGIPVKFDDWDDGARVLAIFGNIGLKVKFRKH